MTTDIATVAAGEVMPAVQPTAAVLSLADWARELDAATAIAVKLVQTSFAPKHFRGKPTEAAAAILTGHELGLTPMASLRSIFDINGTPGMYAKVMVAIAQSRGHEVWVAEQSDIRVVVKGRRKGSPNVYETEWTPERCKLAGLESNPKYRTARQQMMVARGQAEIARQVAADALHGVPYSVEELEDMPPVRATATVTAADLLADMPTPAVEMARAPRAHGDPGQGHADPAPTTRRGNYPAADETSAGHDLNVPAEPQPITLGPPPEPQGITGPQMRKLQALFKEAGIDDRVSRLAWASDVAKRELATSSDLTRVEAGNVIEAIEAFIAERVEASAEVNAEQPELS